MLCVVPVTLENPETGKTVQTYGLIDKGAEPVIIQKDIADTLGLTQRPAGFVLGHFDGQADDQPDHANVTFHDANGTRHLIKDILVMPKVNTSDRQVNLPLMQSE